MPNGLFGALRELINGFTKSVTTFQERAVSVSAIGSEVFEQFYNQGAWLNDLYLENGAIFAVASEGGKLFRASIDIDENGDITLGEMQEVVTNFDAVSRTSFSTSDDGKVRMLAVSATSVINNNGEIDSRNLFDSMSDYMKRTGKRIPRTFFHAGPEFRTGDITWMARDDNVLLTITEFDDSELANKEIAAREKDPDYWGDSIEFDPVGDPEMLDVGDGITVPVYRAGIPMAVSTLAAERACSLYANKFIINRQEVKRMALKDADRIDLIKAFDGDEEETDQWLEENVSSINREIADTHQVNREEATEGAEDSETETPEAEVETELEGEVETEVETEEEEVTEESEVEAEPEAEESADEVIVEFDDEMALQVANTVLESDSFVQFRDSVTEIVDGIKTSLAELTGTVTELQAASVARTKDIQELKKDEAKKKKEWVEDLPRNTNQQRVLVRPRNNASEDDPGDPSMQDIAAETVAMLEEA